MKGRFLLLLVILLAGAQFISAANVGVSPANINFQNVLRSGYAERPILVTVDSDIPTTIEVETYGEAANWINFTSDFLEVSRGNPLQLMVSTSPPSDIPNGNYSAMLRIKTSKLGDASENQATGLVIPTLDVSIITEVTDQEIYECKATNFKISNAEEGEDIILSLDIENKGNIIIKPKTTLDIWDDESINLVDQEELYPSQIPPTTKQSFTFKISSEDLDIGQYWTDVAVPDCYSSQTLTFDVLEEGALYAAGKLVRIIMDPWAEIGDIVSFQPVFKNTGEKALEAKFVGQVTYKNKVIQLIESNEELLVPVDEQESFQFYFTPSEAGKYIISGRVFYDNKRTYEQSAVLNVNPASAISTILKAVSYIVLILLISILIYKIRKERRSYLKLKSRR